MCYQLCKQMLFSSSAINENTQGLFPRSLQVSAFMEATFSQTQQKVHVLSCSVQNTLCVDSQGTVVWDLKIKESDVGKGFDCYAIRSDCGVTFPFCLLKSTLPVQFTLQLQTAKHSFVLKHTAYHFKWLLFSCELLILCIVRAGDSTADKIWCVSAKSPIIDS